MCSKSPWRVTCLPVYIAHSCGRHLTSCYICVISLCIWHASSICVTRMSSFMWHTPHSHVWRDFIYGTKLNACDMSQPRARHGYSYVWHDVCMGHDLLTCVTRLVQVRLFLLICVTDSLMCVSWLVHTRDMTYAHVTYRLQNLVWSGYDY